MDGPAREPLGVGRLFSKSFSLLFSRFLPLVLIPLAPTVASGAIGMIFFADILAMIASGTMTNPLDIYTPAYLAFSFISGVVYFIFMGALTLASYDVARGEPITLGEHLSRAVRAAPVLFILSIVAMLAIGVSMIFLIVPGLYVMARLWVLYPAIMIDRSGWRALGRSWELSREYSWPLVGLMLLIFALMFGIAIALGLTMGAGLTLGTQLPDIGRFGLVAYAIQLGVNALIYSYASMLSVVVYMRLCEIKEGSAHDAMAEIFT